MSIYICQLLVHARTEPRELGRSHSYSTRNECLLKIPHQNTPIFEHNPRCSAISYYNRFPSSVKTLPLNKFKIDMNKMFIGKAYFGICEFLEDDCLVE